MTGKIKKIVSDRGFGFITPDDNTKDLFFHVKGLGNCEWDALREGDRVTFEVEQAERGPKAVRVCLP